MMETTKFKKIFKLILTLLIIVGVFIGWYLYSGLKFLPPHFHANFAMYIDSERVDFSGDNFMEDIAACGLSDLMFPEHRVHLHENNPDTIHVHAQGVSWGHFFANNGIIFNDNLISLQDGEQILTPEANNKISFLLNWEVVINPYNDLIKSEDSLIIVYWDDSNISELFVSDNAKEYNAKYDPGSCGWTNEGWISALLWNLLHGLIWH